jgi:hypothetical protein
MKFCHYGVKPFPLCPFKACQTMLAAILKWLFNEILTFFKPMA